MKAKILLSLLEASCKFNDKSIYVSVNKKLIPCTRIASDRDKIIIETETEKEVNND